MRSVLVTAVGGDLGQAVVKALRLDEKTHPIFGCDADPRGVGPAFVDGFDAVPMADDPCYVEALEHMCHEWGVDAVIPASEAEIRALSALGPHRPPIICQPAAFIRTHGDKLLCMERLSTRIELAPFADGDDASYLYRLMDRAGFPLVVKSRTSSGSRTFRLVSNWAELCKALDQTSKPLVQAPLEGDEYSVGLFSCEAFTSALAFRRVLVPGIGCTWEAEVDQDPEVLRYALQISNAVSLRGSINVQVRKTAAGVRLLEINPRFSSLAAARAACGFRDVEWSVDLALGQRPELGELFSARFHRFFGEVMDFGSGYRALPRWTPRGVL